MLSLTGRHIIDSKNITKILTEKSEFNFLAKILDEKNKPKKLFKIPISSELF